MPFGNCPVEPSDIAYQIVHQLPDVRNLAYQTPRDFMRLVSQTQSAAAGIPVREQCLPSDGLRNGCELDSGFESYADSTLTRGQDAGL